VIVSFLLGGKEPGDGVESTHIDAHSCRIRDGLRDFVRELELIPNLVHRRVDLVDVAVCEDNRIRSWTGRGRWMRKVVTHSLPWMPLSTSAPFFIASSVSLFMLADSMALTWHPQRRQHCL
jgi:hypothetical protein